MCVVAPVGVHCGNYRVVPDRYGRVSDLNHSYTARIFNGELPGNLSLWPYPINQIIHLLFLITFMTKEGYLTL